MTEVDQVARDNAASAISLISAHEQVCAERQGHIITSLGELKEDVKGLFLRFWVAAVTLITILIGVCGSLLYLIIAKGAAY